MKGILFKPDMHLAIRELRKTQTRRVIKPEFVMENGVLRWKPRKGVDISLAHLNSSLINKYAKYHVGEVVYIKEAHYAYGEWWWAHGDDSDDVRFIRDATKPIYYADTKPQGLPLKRGHLFADVGWYLRSPMFLPAEFARDFIQITDVRPERLQDISEEEARAEGLKADPVEIWWQGYREWDLRDGRKDLMHVQYIGEKPPADMIEPHKMADRPDLRHGAAYHYSALWDSINKKTPWSSNPWVWVYTFKYLPKPESL